MKKYDYIIVGAGLFGATFAERMTNFGKTCLVIEKRGFPGGLAYTNTTENIDVHVFGAHIFHTSRKEIWDYVCRFAEFNNYVNSPIAISNNTVYNLPFNMNTFSKLWNISTPDQAKEIINRQISLYGVPEPKNLEEQAISLVGKDIYETLIKGYTEKQWGMDATQLPSFIIKRIPVRFTYNNNYFNDNYQGIPIEGYTNMIKNMLTNVPVMYNTDYLANREMYNKMADTVIYTGPIDEFYNYCYGTLEYRSLRFETELLDKENFQGNAVVNYTDKSQPFTRIIEHKHFNPKENQPKTLITREYSTTWHPGTEPFYPINNSRNNELYEKYKKLSESQKKVIFGGRLAEFKYYDMDRTIESALALSRAESEK